MQRTPPRERSSATFLQKKDVLKLIVNTMDQFLGGTTILTGQEIPWVWYVARASGLMAFSLLYLAIFLGAVSGIPALRNFFLSLGSLRSHCWLSLQALIFVFFHLIGLSLDKYLNFSLAEMFIPFHIDYKTINIALGIIGFYLILILVISSYLMRFLPRLVWRIIHFLNLVLYIVVFLHILYLGTDFKFGWPRDLFIVANGILIYLLLLNLFFRIKRKNATMPRSS